MQQIKIQDTQLNLNFREIINNFYTIGSCAIHCLTFEFNWTSCISSGNHTSQPVQSFPEGTSRPGREGGWKGGRKMLELRDGETMVGIEEQKSCVWGTNQLLRILGVIRSPMLQGCQVGLRCRKLKGAKWDPLKHCQEMNKLMRVFLEDNLAIHQKL